MGEFTSYIVDSGLAVSEHDPLSIEEYRPNLSWEDTPIEKTSYFMATDTLGVIEQQSPSLKLYSGAGCQFLRKLCPETYLLPRTCEWFHTMLSRVPT